MRLEGKLHQKQTSWVEPGCPFSGKHSGLRRPMGHRGWFASYGGQLLRKSWTQTCLWQVWKKCAPWLWPVSKHTKRWAHYSLVCWLLYNWYVKWIFQLHLTKWYFLVVASVSVEANEHTGSIRQICPEITKWMKPELSIYFNKQLVYWELQCTSWCFSVNATQVQWGSITSPCLTLNINWKLTVPWWPN